MALTLATLRDSQIVDFLASNPPWNYDHFRRCSLVRALFRPGERKLILDAARKRVPFVYLVRSVRLREQDRSGDILRHRDKYTDRFEDYKNCFDSDLFPSRNNARAFAILEYITGYHQNEEIFERRGLSSTGFRLINCARFHKKPVVLVSRTYGSTHFNLLCFRGSRPIRRSHILRVQSSWRRNPINTVKQAFDWMGGPKYLKAKKQKLEIIADWDEHRFIAKKHYKNGKTKETILDWRVV